MERLDTVGDSSPYFRPKSANKKEEKKSERAKGKKIFSRTLADTHTADTEMREVFGLSSAEDIDLEKNLDDIHDMGERLKENPNLALVKNYRRAVGTFMRYVIKKGYTLEKKRLEGFRVLKLPKGQQPELTLIQVVDKKLDDLAHQILQNQRDQLEILRRIDEIHGMLVDLIT